jgi:hypothetical protein
MKTQKQKQHRQLKKLFEQKRLTFTNLNLNFRRFMNVFFVKKLQSKEMLRLLIATLVRGLFTVGVSTKTQPQLLDAYPVGCDAK